MKNVNLVLSEENLSEVIKHLEPFPYIEVSNGEHMKAYSFEYVEGMQYGFIWQLYEINGKVDYELLKEALCIHAEALLKKLIGYGVSILYINDEVRIEANKNKEFVRIIGSHTEKVGWEE